VINYSKAKRIKYNGLIYRCLLSAIIMLLLSSCGQGNNNKTYTISGRITSAGSSMAGVTVILAGDTSMSTTTDVAGNYTFTGVPGGTFTVTPFLAGSPFRPLFRMAFLNGIDGTGFDFFVHGLGRLAMATHAMYVKDDGTVLAWGNNNNGQLGDGSTTTRYNPVTVSGLSGMKSVAAGSGHTVALKNDGTIWAWGNNSNGQLGDGTLDSRTTPVQVSLLTGMTAVAAGYGHTVALKNDGTVWAWGNNDSGQLGDGSSTSTNIPVPVAGLSSITAVAAGAYHTVVLKSDGTVWSWGKNSNGQLGNGNITASNVPVQVKGLSGVSSGIVTAVAAGYDHTVILRNDGTVWSWGNNSNGQLGNGNITASNAPVQVSGLSTVTAIAAGFGHSLALKSDGTVWTWGNNSRGQLGNGLTNGVTIDSAIPVLVSNLPSVVDIAGGYEGSVALKGLLRGDGTLWLWGSNSNGQLGNGLVNATMIYSAIPVQALLP